MPDDLSLQMVLRLGVRADRLEPGRALEGRAASIGNLLGTRMVLNEFIAFAQLGPMKETLDPRSFTVATFALCGFANFASIGIQIGGIGALVPERRHDLARLGMRAMLAGTLANFVSACIAALLAVVRRALTGDFDRRSTKPPSVPATSRLGRRAGRRHRAGLRPRRVWREPGRRDRAAVRATFRTGRRRSVVGHAGKLVGGHRAGPARARAVGPRALL